MESNVAAFLHTDNVNEELSSLLAGELAALLARLERLVNGRAAKAVEGPVSLGDSKRLCHREVREELAACYLASARGSSRSYPYFEPGKVSL